MFGSGEHFIFGGEGRNLNYVSTLLPVFKKRRQIKFTFSRVFKERKVKDNEHKFDIFSLQNFLQK